MAAFDEIAAEVEHRANQRQQELVARCIQYLTAVRVGYINKLVGQAAGQNLTVIDRWMREDKEYALRVADYIKAKRELGYRSRQRDALAYTWKDGYMVQDDETILYLAQKVEDLEKKVRERREAKNEAAYGRYTSMARESLERSFMVVGHHSGSW